MRLYEIEQRIPVSTQYNQDRGNLDWIVLRVESIAAELGDDLSSLERRVNLRQLKATQDWLDSEAGGGDPVFPGIPEEYDHLPVVADTGQELLILDGHHRLNRALDRGAEIALVLVFKVK